MLLFKYLLLFMSQALAVEKTPIVFGVHPLHNAQKLFQLFNPLCEYLNSQINEIECSIETSKNYSDYNQKIKDRHFDLTFPNPYQTIRSLEYGYEVIGKWSNDELFKGIIVVRKDSGIKKIEQLRGKIIAFPATTALAATLIPQLYLKNKKLLRDTDYTPHYLGSQDSVLMAVYNKTVVASSTWYIPWYQFKNENSPVFSELEILAETESLPNNGIMLKKELSAHLKSKIQKALIEYGKTDQEKMNLEKIGIQKFEKASEKSYAPVKTFLKKYTKEYGAIEW